MPRTTHPSKSGKKLYAKRSKAGRITDVQTYERAHGSDVKRTSAAEKATRKTSKQANRKKSAKKKAAKKK